MSASKSKLAAVMFTDIKGSSARMFEDEAQARENLKEHNQLLESYFKGRGSVVHKKTGDGFLVAFENSFDALNCAIEIQRAIGTRNVQVSPERRFEIRIGIHMGDVFFEENDVIGSAVNIAARIMDAAKGGEIWFSTQIWEENRNKVKGLFESAGEHELKGIGPLPLHKIPRRRLVRGQREGSNRRFVLVSTVIVILALLFLVWRGLWGFLGFHSGPEAQDSVTKERGLSTHPSVSERTKTSDPAKEKKLSPTQVGQRPVDPLVKENWRSRLRLGMTKSEVRKLFGNPDNISVIGSSEFWDYGSGQINFYEGRLDAWFEPSLDHSPKSNPAVNGTREADKAKTPASPR